MDPTLDAGLDAIEGDLADDLRSQVKAELEPGERLLWAARPITKPRPLGSALVPATLLLIGLSLVTLVAFSVARGEPVDAQWKGGLLLAGLGSFLLTILCFSSLVSLWRERRSDLAKRAGSLYALTDRRAIIWIPHPAKGAMRVRTFVKGSIAEIHRIEYPDGTGDVLFCSKEATTLFGRGGGDFAIDPNGYCGFASVAKARYVEEQVRRTLLGPPDSAV